MIINKQKSMQILSEIEVEKIKDVSANILEETGCKINDDVTISPLQFTRESLT